MPLLPNQPLIPPQGPPIFFQGPPLEEGLLPAVFYFALSANMTLFEDPFNQPVLRLVEHGIRVFSWDLPFHGPSDNPNEAMAHWATEFMLRPWFISDFLNLCQTHIHYLINQNLVNPEQSALAGLSRGGFIAAHLGALNPNIKTILGFAPLTQPKPLIELTDSERTSFEKVSLMTVSDQLIHTRLRFYIGNRDQRVSTDACYSFIRHLTDTAFNQGIRSPSAELIIYPSIGHKGHGTPSYIFRDGADWIQRQLGI